MMTLNEICAMHGLPIPTEPHLPDDYLFGVFEFPVNIPTGNTADIDLRAAGIFNGDERVAKYHGTAANPEVVVQFNAMRLVVDSGNFAVIDIAEKAKLYKNTKITFAPQGETFTYSLRRHIVDPYADRTLATADDGANHDLATWKIFTGKEIHRIDPRRDQCYLEFDAAAPTASGGLDCYLEVIGCVVPNSVDGAKSLGSAERGLNQWRNQIAAELALALAA